MRSITEHWQEWQQPYVCCGEIKRALPARQQMKNYPAVKVTIQVIRSFFLVRITCASHLDFRDQGVRGEVVHAFERIFTSRQPVPARLKAGEATGTLIADKSIAQTADRLVDLENDMRASRAILDQVQTDLRANTKVR